VRVTKGTDCYTRIPSDCYTRIPSCRIPSCSLKSCFLSLGTPACTPASMPRQLQCHTSFATPASMRAHKCGNVPCTRHTRGQEVSCTRLGCMRHKMQDLASQVQRPCAEKPCDSRDEQKAREARDSLRLLRCFLASPASIAARPRAEKTCDSSAVPWAYNLRERERIF